MNSILARLRDKRLDIRPNGLAMQVDEALRELQTPGEWENARTEWNGAGPGVEALDEATRSLLDS